MLAFGASVRASWTIHSELRVARVTQLKTPIRITAGEARTDIIRLFDDRSAFALLGHQFAAGEVPKFPIALQHGSFSTVARADVGFVLTYAPSEPGFGSVQRRLSGGSPLDLSNSVDESHQGGNPRNDTRNEAPRFRDDGDPFVTDQASQEEAAEDHPEWMGATLDRSDDGSGPVEDGPKTTKPPFYNSPDSSCREEYDDDEEDPFGPAWKGNGAPDDTWNRGQESCYKEEGDDRSHHPTDVVEDGPDALVAPVHPAQAQYHKDLSIPTMFAVDDPDPAPQPSEDGYGPAGHYVATGNARLCSRFLGRLGQRRARDEQGSQKGREARDSLRECRVFTHDVRSFSVAGCVVSTQGE